MRRLLQFLPLDWLAFGLLLLVAGTGVLVVAGLGLPGPFILLPVAAFFGGLVYLWPSRRRARALERAAARLGLTYVGNGNPFGADTEFDRRHYELLWRPDTTYGFALRNLMRGTEPFGEVSLFDFRYNSVEGYSFDQTVAAFAVGRRLPQFSLVPKGMFDRAFFAAASAVGLKRDIDFDSHPDFTRRYLVRGPDEASVRALLTPGVLELWASLPARGWSACGAGRWLLVYRDHRLVPASGLSEFLEQARTLAAALAEH